MKIHLYERSTVLFRQGDPPRYAYVVLSGVVNFYDENLPSENVPGSPGDVDYTGETSWDKTLLTEVEPKAGAQCNAGPAAGKNLLKDKSQNQLRTIRPLDEAADLPEL